MFSSTRARAALPTALLAALLGTSALAQPAPTEAQAQELAQSFTDWLTGTFADAEDFEVTTPLQVDVDVSGDGYRVTMPAIIAVARDEGEDGEPQVSDVGIAATSFTLVPLSDTLYRISDFDLPETLLTVTERETGEVTSLSITGERRVEGTWSTVLDNIIDADMRLTDFVLTAPAGELMRIDALEVESESEGEDVIDQTARYSLSGIVAQSPEDESEIRIGGIEITSDVTDLDLSRVAQLNERFQDPALMEPSTPEQIAEMQDFLRGLGPVIGSLETAMNVTDFTVQAPDGMNFALPSATFGMRGTGLNEDTATLGLTYGHSGLSLDPSPAPAELIPSEVRVNLALEQLPTDALTHVFIEAMGTGMLGEGPETDAQMEALGQELMAAAIEAGSRLVIDPVLIEAPAMALELTGQGTMAPESPVGFVGDALLIARGLETAIEIASTLPDPEMAMQAQMMLGMLQALGQTETNDAGETVRRYDLTFTPEGQVLLNGQPLDALFGQQ